MGKTRQTGDIVSDNNLSLDIASDTFNLGIGVTINAGTAGIVEAASNFMLQDFLLKMASELLLALVMEIRAIF